MSTSLFVLLRKLNTAFYYFSMFILILLFGAKTVVLEYDLSIEEPAFLCIEC